MQKGVQNLYKNKLIKKLLIHNIRYFFCLRKHSKTDELVVE